MTPWGRASLIPLPIRGCFPQGQIAQLVEQRTENPRVVGSIPTLATIFRVLTLLTAIEGFTQKTSRKSRADIVRMIEEHQAIVLPVL